VRLQAAGLVFLIAAGLLTLLAVGPAAHSAPTSPVALRVVAPGAPVGVGQSFDVEVAVDNASDLGAFEVDITWNSQVLTLTGTTLLAFLGAPENCDPMAGRCAVRLGPAYLAADEARIGAYSYGTGPGATGNGVLTRLHFTTLGTGTSPLTLTDPLVVDTAVNVLATNLSGGSVTVVEATATPTATTTPSATPTPTVPLATPTPTATAGATPNHRLFIPLVRRQSG